MIQKIFFAIVLLVVIGIGWFFYQKPSLEEVVEETLGTATSTAKLPPGSAAPGTAADVTANMWIWEKTVLANGSTTVPGKPDMFSLTFGTDGRLMGTTDCNGFFGQYVIGSDGVLTLGELGSTKMFCEGSQEVVFTNMVASVVRYNIDEAGNLLLHMDKKAGVMTFNKKIED